MRRRALLGASMALAAWPVGRAHAHAMPNSHVGVEIAPGAVRLAISIPMSELVAALGDAPAAEADILARLILYLGEHIAIVGDDGRPWEMVSEDAASAHGRDGEHAVVAVILRFAAPPGASDRAATLRYDAVTHRVASHYALFYRQVNGEMAPLGRLQLPETTLRLP